MKKSKAGLYKVLNPNFEKNNKKYKAYIQFI